MEATPRCSSFQPPTLSRRGCLLSPGSPAVTPGAASSLWKAVAWLVEGWSWFGSKGKGKPLILEEPLFIYIYIYVYIYVHIMRVQIYKIEFLMLLLVGIVMGYHL